MADVNQQSSPQSSPALNSVPPPTSESRFGQNPPSANKINWTRWIIVMVLIALFSSGGTYFVLNQNEQKPQATPIVQTASPTPNPTVDWETYVSPLGFSVKAPASFKQGCKLGDIEIEEFCIESLGTKKEFQDKDVEGGGAWVVTQGGVLVVSQDKETKLPLTKEAVCNPGGGIKVLSCEEDILDGVPAFKRVAGDPERVTIFALKDGASYTTSLWYSDLEAKQSLDQILSTFKFTSQ